MSREGVFEKMGTGFSSSEKALGVTKVLRSRLCTRLLSCPSIPHTLFKPDFCIENILKTFPFSDVNIHSQILLPYLDIRLSLETRPCATSYPESLDTRLCINLKTV